MDVRCERCRAQYALEDDRVTEAGLTIRCSSCGHTFRVKRKALFVTVPIGPDEPAGPVATPRPTAAAVPAPEKREWRVRQPNGNVFTCKELTTLQKWIVERRVGRDDEISLSGDQWKRLGDIAELASFFQVVEAADRAPAAAATTLTFPSPQPASPETGSQPSAARPSAATSPSRQPGLPAHAPYVNAASEPAGSALRSPIKSEAAGAAWEAKPAAPLRASAPEPAWAADGKPAAPVRERPRREGPPVSKGSAGGRLALVVVVLAIAGGGAAVYVLQPGWLGLGQPASPRIEPAPAAPAPVTQASPKPVPATPVADAKPPPAPVAAPSSEPPPQPAPAATPSSEPKLAPPPLAARTAGAKPEPSPAGTSGTGETKPPTSSASASSSPGARPSPPLAAPAAPEKPRPEPASTEAASVAPRQPAAPAASEQSVSVAPAPQATPGPRKETSKKESASRRSRILLAQARKLRDRGKSHEALGVYGQAAELEPNNPDVLAGQGWCYLDLSQYASAVESFEAALGRAPNHPEALMGLAETYRYEGRNADAVKYYKRYIAAHPNGDDAGAARHAISQLKE